MGWSFGIAEEVSDSQEIEAHPACDVRIEGFSGSRGCPPLREVPGFQFAGTDASARDLTLISPRYVGGEKI
jgi:hypothetical protein